MEDHSIDPEMKKLQDAVLDPDTTRKVSTISGVEVDPHTKVAAKEAKDEGQPRQQAMAENFRGVRQPEIGDIVLTGLELPGLIGQRKLAIMPALVVAISEDNPSLVGLDAFFPLNSGTPAIGQIWATHATTPTLGAWWWPKKPAPAPQKPSVGRAVHFYPKHDLGGPLHATITAMSSGEVSQLCVLGTLRGEPNVSTGPSGVDTGAFFLDNVPFSETPKPSHWSWPVFVK